MYTIIHYYVVVYNRIHRHRHIHSHRYIHRHMHVHRNKHIDRHGTMSTFNLSQPYLKYHYNIVYPRDYELSIDKACQKDATVVDSSLVI